MEKRTLAWKMFFFCIAYLLVLPILLSNDFNHRITAALILAPVFLSFSFQDWKDHPILMSLTSLIGLLCLMAIARDNLNEVLSFLRRGR